MVRDPAGFTIPLSMLNASDAHIPARHASFTRDVVLPVGTWVNVHIYSVHNSVDNWVPNAKEFRPERFLPTGSFLGKYFILLTVCITLGKVLFILQVSCNPLKPPRPLRAM